MYCWLNPESSASCSWVRPFSCLTRLTFRAGGFGRCNSGLSFRPTTAAEWFRRGLAWSRHDEELDYRGTEGIRKLLEHTDRRILQPAFEAAYVSSIDTSVGGESLL
jgi:hypothetical protein